MKDKTDDTKAKAFEDDDQNWQDQHQAMRLERLLLSRYYQVLYEQYQRLIERSPSKQRKGLSTETYHQMLQDFGHSFEEHRRSILDFRHRLHMHRSMVRESQRNQTGPKQANRSLIRKAILIGDGNGNDATFLKESLQRESTHRVFLATDSEQVLRLAQTVHIDLLVLDSGLITHPGIELYHYLHSMNGPQALPAIILSDSFSPKLQEELARHHLIGLEKPIKVETLIKAIDKLLDQERT